MKTAFQTALEAVQANQHNGSCESHRAKTDPLPSRASIAQLFLRFQASFGHRWLSLAGDEHTQAIALAEWRHQLAGLSLDEIEAGYERMLTRPVESRYWPPTPAEYRDLCRPPRRHREPYERREFQAALPQKPASAETARRHLAALRGRLAAAPAPEQER